MTNCVQYKIAVVSPYGLLMTKGLVPSIATVGLETVSDLILTLI